MKNPPLPWRRQQRKKLSGVREPHRFDPEPLGDATHCWRTLRDRYRALDAVREVEVDGEARAFFDQLEAQYKSDVAFALPEEAELLRALLAVHLSQDSTASYHAHTWRELMGFWVGTLGITETWRLRSTDATFAARSRSHTPGVWPSKARIGLEVGAGDTPFRIDREPGNGASRALREVVFQMSEAKFDEGRDALEAVQVKASGWTSERAHFAFVFAREPRWAASACEGLLGEIPTFDTGNSWALLLASVDDPGRAAALIDWVSPSLRRSYASMFADFAYDLVESLGVGAAPVLEQLTSWDGRSSNKNPFRSPLKLTLSNRE